MLLLFSAIFVNSSQSLVPDQTHDRVNEAYSRLIEAYLAALNAERAGANVTILINQLNTAQALLVGANASFSEEDYANATLLADQCIDSASQITQEAASLKSLAESQQMTSLFRTYSFSIVGLILLSIVCLVGWKLIRKRYLKRVVVMKPTVVDNA